jgi:hypothetical protein
MRPDGYSNSGVSRDDWYTPGRGIGPYQGERVAEQHEARAVVGEVVADLVERLVDYFVVILADFVGSFVDEV